MAGAERAGNEAEPPVARERYIDATCLIVANGPNYWPSYRETCYRSPVPCRNGEPVGCKVTVGAAMWANGFALWHLKTTDNTAQGA
jgi:hypothetical protein